LLGQVELAVVEMAKGRPPALMAQQIEAVAAVVGMLQVK
jgi:hypothetical protein